MWMGVSCEITITVFRRSVSPCHCFLEESTTLHPQRKDVQLG